MSLRPTPTSSMIGVGQTIGNYKITAKLGEGGMGVVYLAEHPVIGKKVAMKAIHPELSRNAEVVSRFVMEAKSVNQIGHEHIVDISDFGNTTDGEFYFVMEYLQGESLADRLKRMGSLSLTRALSIAAQVADALGASHQQRIIHRDLKPENVFLISRGRNPDFVKVLDFGLAKLSQNEEKVSHKTRTGSVMGTPYYMSPEQCEGKLSIDNRADIYSLGIILFEMLTGKVPFGGEGYGEIIVKHVTHQAPSARSLNPEIPAEVEMILYHALAKDRAERFQSMQELREALLDPEGYAASAPALGLSQDESGVARAAAPMARTDMNLGLPAPPSTLRQGMGEMLDEVTLTPRSGRKVVLGLMGGVALAGVVIALVAGGRSPGKRAATATAPPAATSAPAAPVVKTPEPVRVNFASDPVGATVVRADTGRELGKTPLSIDVPYSDSPMEFVLKLPGHENKTLRIVPNMATPLSATLRPLPPTPHLRRLPVPVKKVEKKPEKRPAMVDEDAVLEPSFQ